MTTDLIYIKKSKRKADLERRKIKERREEIYCIIIIIIFHETKLQECARKVESRL